MAQKVFRKGLPSGLRKEINNSLMFLAETDKKIYGRVTMDTKKAFRVQKVVLPKKYR